MTRFLPIAGLLALVAIPASADIEIDNAWVRAMPPTQRMTAGYGTLRNTGDSPVIIAGARSPVAKMTELHTTIKEGSQMRMVPLDPVTLGPGESFDFMPGGPHVMLMGVAQMPAEGSEVELCFLSAPGEAYCITAPVSRGAPGDHGHGHH